MRYSIEDVPPKSTGMSLKKFWKLKMVETLKGVYGDTLKEADIEIYLNKALAMSKSPLALLRNNYTEKSQDIYLDEILKSVKMNDINITANGTYYVRQSVKKGEIGELLVSWLKRRSEVKKLALKAEREGDFTKARKYDNLSDNYKQYNNSSYGIASMNGSILYSPDSASSITAQARELISEASWGLEKFLGSNLCFDSLNEMFACINEVTRVTLNEELIKKYNIKIPTKAMINERMVEYISYLPDVYRDKISTTAIDLLINNIAKDKNKAINFYYRNNLLKFFDTNQKVMDIVDWFVSQNESFQSPFISEMEKDESKVYIEPLQELNNLCMEFVIFVSPTHNRVDKYINRKRRIILVSDTDSVIIRLDKWINFVSKRGKIHFDTFYDEKQVFKVANIMSFIATEVVCLMARNMTKDCYVEESYRERIALKNEFFFKSLIVFPNVKKNYSALTTLREGVKVNKFSNTGSALTGSNNNPFVIKWIDDIIYEEIHTVKDINLTRIMKRVYDLEDHIRNALTVEQNLTFARTVSYRNNEGKVNMWLNVVIRGVELWNHIYPENKIEKYNKVYLLSTKLKTENDLHLVEDPVMREYLMEKVFRNPVSNEAKKFGLGSIALPITMTKYPAWMAPIIDVDKIVETHLQPMVSILPATGIYINRFTSNRTNVSSMIYI